VFPERRNHGQEENRGEWHALQLPVQWGNLNVGDETARLGLSVHRGSLTVSQADRHLCGKRLRLKTLARGNGAQASQEAIPGLDGGDVELEASPLALAPFRYPLCHRRPLKRGLSSGITAP
jgi:hypothetical protein